MKQKLNNYFKKMQKILIMWFKKLWKCSTCCGSWSISDLDDITWPKTVLAISYTLNYRSRFGVLYSKKMFLFQLAPSSHKYVWGVIKQITTWLFQESSEIIFPSKENIFHTAIMYLKASTGIKMSTFFEGKREN